VQLVLDAREHAQAFGVEIETPKAQAWSGGDGMGRGCPRPHPTMGMWIVVSSSNRVRGGAYIVRNRFWYNFSL